MTKSPGDLRRIFWQCSKIVYVSCGLFLCPFSLSLKDWVVRPM